MGFQTLAIEKRASEVWEVLGAVKTEFGKFGEVLSRVKRQLGTVRRTIDQAEVRTRAMERRLRSVERLPEAEAGKVLAPDAGPGLADSRAEDGRGNEATKPIGEDPDGEGPGPLSP
jgi:DNA recombination protein RmuC